MTSYTKCDECKKEVQGITPYSVISAVIEIGSDPMLDFCSKNCIADYYYEYSRQ